jgi:glycosyltransferase involved in cell wall biosynthesis
MNEQSMVKKRIAFVSPNAWTMYNFRKEVLQSILQSGFEVIIIAGEDKYASLLVSMGCLFIPVSVNNRSLWPADDVLLFLRLKAIYKKYRPDFIFHYVVKPNIYGTLAARVLKIPSIAVITGLGHALNENSFLQVLIKSLYRLSLRYAYEIWCLNEEDAAFFVQNHIAPMSKIKILPGEGINTVHFKKDKTVKRHNPTFTYLMSARLLKSKGIIEYADAALILKQKNISCRCILIGAVEKHPDAILSEDIASWQQNHRLEYLGFTDDVRTHFYEADCFVYPSYYNEGIPRSLLEACCMELPVITTDNTGCRDLIIDGVNGFLCKKHDPVSLANKMEMIWKLDSNKRISMGIRGRELIETKYSMDKVVSFYTRVLQFLF